MVSGFTDDQQVKEAPPLRRQLGAVGPARADGDARADRGRRPARLGLLGRLRRRAAGHLERRRRRPREEPPRRDRTDPRGSRRSETSWLTASWTVAWRAARGAAHAAPAGPSATARTMRRPGATGGRATMRRRMPCNNSKPGRHAALTASTVRFRLMQALARRATPTRAQRGACSTTSWRPGSLPIASRSKRRVPRRRHRPIPSHPPRPAPLRQHRRPHRACPARGALRHWPTNSPAAPGPEARQSPRDRKRTDRHAGPAASPAEPELIDYFRDTWTRVSSTSACSNRCSRCPSMPARSIPTT